MTRDRQDPRRTLDLLWAGQPQPARGPKPALSLDRIVRTAIDIADADGLHAVSMRRVAEDLGFTTMSLYRYVSGKNELLDLMMDVAFPSLPPPNEPEEWRDGLARWARETLAAYRSRPWSLQAQVSSAPLGPKQVAWMEWALQAMSGSGLSDDEMLEMLMVLTGYVRGHAEVTLMLAQVEDRTGTPETEWNATYAVMLQRIVEGGQHPNLARLALAGTFGAPDDSDDAWLDHTFEFGLQRIFDGADMLIAERASVPE